MDRDINIKKIAKVLEEKNMTFKEVLPAYPPQDWDTEDFIKFIEKVAKNRPKSSN